MPVDIYLYTGHIYKTYCRLLLSVAFCPKKDNDMNILIYYY